MNERKKYRLTDETITTIADVTLYRIQATRDFGNVRKGERGGFIESENNLSQENSCWVYGDAEVCGNVEVKSSRDYIVFKNFWSSGRYFTYTRSNGMWTVGCFHGTGEELIRKAYADSKEKGWQYERVVRYVEDVERHEKEQGGGGQMSEKMKDGKWYVPKDLGIVKATEEQGGTYYRYKGEDGKDRWIPAKVFNEMFLPAAKSEIPERFADETAEWFFQRSFPKEEVDGFPKGDVEHFKSMLSDFARYTANRFLRALVISKMAEEADHA